MSRELVYCLGPHDSPVFSWLRKIGHPIVITEDPITKASVESNRPEFLVSHGYRHILKPDVLDLMPGRAINLHISYLPFNRGADPNLWSWIDVTPKGVTAHLIDPGVDTGPIIAQTTVGMGKNETLRTSYRKLQDAAFWLFVSVWGDIRSGNISPVKQNLLIGRTHKTSDKGLLPKDLLWAGWDTPVSDLEEYGIDLSLSRGSSDAYREEVLQMLTP